MADVEADVTVGQSKKRTFKKFSYRGMDLDALLDISTDDLVKIFNAHPRRKFQRGLKRKPMALIKKLRKAILTLSRMSLNIVGEMMSASNIDDAKARGSQALEMLEKSICAHAAKATACSFQQENIMLKQQVEALVQEIPILKQAVAIRHEHQKGFEERDRELNQLKQLVAQYQKHIRTLEELKKRETNGGLRSGFHVEVCIN